MTRTVELLKERFGFYYVGIFLLDKTSETPRAVLKAGTGAVGVQMLRDRFVLPLTDKTLVGWTIITGRAPL